MSGRVIDWICRLLISQFQKLSNPHPSPFHLVRVTQEAPWSASRATCGSSLELLVLVMAVPGPIGQESTPECPVTSPGSTPTSALMSQALCSSPPVDWILTAATLVLVCQIQLVQPQQSLLQRLLILPQLNHQPPRLQPELRLKLLGQRSKPHLHPPLAQALNVSSLTTVVCFRAIV